MLPEKKRHHCYPLGDHETASKQQGLAAFMWFTTTHHVITLKLYDLAAEEKKDNTPYGGEDRYYIRYLLLYIAQPYYWGLTL